MVPDGWKKDSLQSLAARPISYGIVQTGESTPDGVPCVRVVDMTRKIMSRRDMITTTDEVSRQYRKTVLDTGDIIMALRGEIGLARLVGEELKGCNLTRGVARIAANKTRVSPAYLACALRSEFFRTLLLKRVNGSALQEIPLGELRQVDVLVPPLEEQVRIVEFLSAWDQALSVVDALIDNSKRLTVALMRLLLTPDAGPPLAAEPWREVAVGAMGTVVGGGTPDSGREDYWGGDIPWATPTDITALTSRHIASTARTISASGLKNSAARLLPAGALLMCTRATIGDLAIAACPMATNQGFKALIPSKDHDVDFLYYLFLHNVRLFRRQASGYGDQDGTRCAHAAAADREAARPREGSSLK